MQSLNVLVADDDTAIRTVLNQALSRAGYEVRLTGNAATLDELMSYLDDFDPAFNIVEPRR